MTTSFDPAIDDSFDTALDMVAKVADAVLFEGYLLYPYRASAQKNQLRWQFGVLTPMSWAKRAAENWYSHTECLLEPGPGYDPTSAGADTPGASTLRVRLRFLRLRRRRVQGLQTNGLFADVDRLIVHDASGAETLHMPWDEGLPEVIDTDLPLAALSGEGRTVPVELPAALTEETITDAGGAVVGRLLRETWAVRGRVAARTEEVPGPYGALRLRVRVENTGNTDVDPEGPPAELDPRDTEQGPARDGALRHSLIAAHTVLAMSDGRFLSMTDPPEWARPAVAACVNEHVWPVLGGAPDQPNVMLSSPIILADFPEIAPESPNQLFDGLENDEILTLRTMVLTDEEKREARATDPRAAYLVDAVDSMPPEIFERLHGVIRSMGPAGQGPTSFAEAVPTYSTVSDDVPTFTHETGGRPWWDPAADASVAPDTDSVMVGGHRVAKGARVLLRPNGRSDAQDLFLIGRPATVEAVLHDVDGHVHLAVSLSDDPVSEFQASHGRFRYFRPDEVEVAP